MSSIAFADERITKPLVMSNSNSEVAAFGLPKQLSVYNEPKVISTADERYYSK